MNKPIVLFLFLLVACTTAYEETITEHTNDTINETTIVATVQEIEKTSENHAVPRPLLCEEAAMKVIPNTIILASGQYSVDEELLKFFRLPMLLAENGITYWNDGSEFPNGFNRDKEYNLIRWVEKNGKYYPETANQKYEVPTIEYSGELNNAEISFEILPILKLISGPYTFRRDVIAESFYEFSIVNPRIVNCVLNGTVDSEELFFDYKDHNIEFES